MEFRFLRRSFLELQVNNHLRPPTPRRSRWCTSTRCRPRPPCRRRRKRIRTGGRRRGRRGGNGGGSVRSSEEARGVSAGGSPRRASMGPEDSRTGLAGQTRKPGRARARLEWPGASARLMATWRPVDLATWTKSASRQVDKSKVRGAGTGRGESAFLNGLAVVDRRTFGGEGRSAFAAERWTKTLVGRTLRAATGFVQAQTAKKRALGLAAALPLFPGDDDIRRFHLEPPFSSPGTPAGTAHDDETVSLLGEQSRDETRKLERALKQVLRCENIRFCGFDVHGVRASRKEPREGFWPVRGVTRRRIPERRTLVKHGHPKRRTPYHFSVPREGPFW